ncbi:class I SAM-dependent methyltransferase [Nocardioides sp. YIM 152315]|uniref:methyltransferase domain-containing protein n=1 Tax=Nocardioides sp. YIM 152315 TaxID=3031760 RepID=UPI0023DC5BD8|nr:class I SAM-dependent methyltransferase [Nocardioides sp. YIM 152315]MDF1605539.1 class I SAM-dependent methyltransferase [Nocardioides sp. YIM 152315]
MSRPLVSLRLERWDHPVDEHDRAVLSRCAGPTLDVGCGPGRLTAALAERGHVALGIDVVRGAVGRAVDRGGSALQRDVFGSLPGEGRWETVLLADGNLGIGGDPVTLLRRLRELLDPRGRVVAEVAPPGTAYADGWATLECGEDRQQVRWSVVGADDIDDIAARAGLAVVDRFRAGARWCVVLEEPAS